MTQRDHVLDLVKAAFVVLIIKVTASSSVLIPWGAFVDNLCVAFAICVTFAKFVRLTLPVGRLTVLGLVSVFALYTCVTMGQYDLLVTVVAIFLLIDEDLEEYIPLMLKIQVLLVIAHVAVSGILSLTGFAERFWFMSNGRLRFNGGFVHSNVLSSYILSCVLMFAWRRFRHITPRGKQAPQAVRRHPQDDEERHGSRPYGQHDARHGPPPLTTRSVLHGHFYRPSSTPT